MKKKKTQLKIIVGVILIILVLRGLINAFTQEWHNEEYLLASTIKSDDLDILEKYYVAGEEIFISAIPQNVEARAIDSIRHGPYKFAFRFGNTTNRDDLSVRIHNINIESDQGSTFSLSDEIQFPITIAGEDVKEGVQYRYLLEKAFELNFNARENIFITLDIEIEKDGQKKREEKTLKLSPVLERGKRLWYPGIDV